MKKIIFVVLVAVLFLANCKSDKGIAIMCNVDNPLTELCWLKELKNQLDEDCYTSCESSIWQGIYKNQVVFYISITSPVCEPVYYDIKLYNCDGEIVKAYNSFSNLGMEITDEKIIYTCTPANRIGN